MFEVFTTATRKLGVQTCCGFINWCGSSIAAQGALFMRSGWLLILLHAAVCMCVYVCVRASVCFVHYFTTCRHVVYLTAELFLLLFCCKDCVSVVEINLLSWLLCSGC